MRLAWNAIVRNESAVIGRCLESLLPHVDCAIVADTGSADDTVDKIRCAFQDAGKPAELHRIPFENFSQARNGALGLARASVLPWEYLLLADADMALRVHKPDWINGHDGLSYDMRQTGGAVTYTNRRLLHRKADGSYLGVTHEYLDVPSSGVIEGADFVDHADGASRPDKFVRDIALLEAALATETRDGLVQRYHFYLAQSYFDSGNFEKALELYRKRVALGGFPEEAWFAQRQVAICCQKLGRHQEFLWESFRAYEMRPQRAEPLYDAARFFRERGENFSSLLLAEAGLAIPRPSDEMLFVNDWIYRYGMREEFGICAYYHKQKRARGAEVVNKLVLDGSEQARQNAYWYVSPLRAYVQSFRSERIAFDPPEGWAALNPSVINGKGQPLYLVRTVNYSITPDGRYIIGNADISHDNPIRTRNFMVSEQGSAEIHLPADLPVHYDEVLGFEDARLFQWRGAIYTLSTVRQLNREGWCEQVLAELVREDGSTDLHLRSWRQILPGDRRHEKNWMPWVDGSSLQFVYRLGTMVGLHGEITQQDDPSFDVSRLSGGSQVVYISPEVFLGLVHEAGYIPGRPVRYYQHRFVEFDAFHRVRHISRPFYFEGKQIEFAAGLAFFPAKRQLLVSYGVKDCEAWSAAMDIDQVLDFIRTEP